MELSMLGCVFQTTLTHPLQLHFSLPVITCSSPATAGGGARTKSFKQSSAALAPAAATLLVEPSNEPQLPPPSRTKSFKQSSAGSRRSWPNSYRDRQATILEIQKSPDIYSALERLGGELRVQDMNAVLRTLGKQSRWKELSQLFDWMGQHSKINDASYCSYIKFIGTGPNPAKAIEIYNDIPDESTKSNVFICNAVLSCLVKRGKFDSSIKMFREMKRNGLTPDAITYTTLLTGCMKVKQGYSKALDLVQELTFNGLQMDTVMYGTLLAICASNNQGEEAENYFNKMKDEGHRPNEFHYSSLLNAYAFSGDYKKAEELVQEMKSSGLVPNKVILTTLLKVYVRGGLFEKSRDLLAELEAQGYAETEMPYCLLMNGFAKRGHIDEARSVFNEMKQKGAKSDGYSYSIMMSALCRAGLFEEAKELAKEFEAKYDKYDVVILNTMLCAYCRAGEMEGVMHIMKKMDEVAISPNYHTFHILIKYFCKEKLYLLAYQTMQDMHKKGHQPEEELSSSLIFHLGRTKAHSEAFSVYSMLRYSKRTMCKALHEKILHILISAKLLKDAYIVVKDNAESISPPAIKKFANAFVKQGNINLINDVLKAIHSSGIKLDQGLFEVAVSRYISQPEKKDLLLQLLQWMPGHGYAVNSKTRNLILKNSQLFGRHVIADILSKQFMISRSLKPN
ncbi:hypothetical protein Tsubulata_022722 [Turnera subulata]|uniref:Pentacotripeptide-repeat region of PRORP domain-containing protein n=1 Tax=Turnera subulata TaxID=218843 RepID=A0A9Q0EZ29_9ROSI|nr:hypothetical protein Tsubulata_022722 [Turnera subulata]